RRGGVGHAARPLHDEADLRAAWDDGYELLPAAGEGRSAGACVRVRERPTRIEGNSGHLRLRARSAQMLLRWRRAAVDGGGLWAFPADAAQRRRTGWRPVAVPALGRVDASGSPRTGLRRGQGIVWPR